jgi:hypothetical protein
LATEIEQGGWIKLDLDQRTAVINGKNDLYQGDALANAIRVKLTKSGEPADLTGYTAEGEMVRSDGSRVPCEGSANGDTAEIVLNEHCYVHAGPYSLSVKLRKGEQERTILRIYGEVQESGTGPVVDITESLVDVNGVLALYKDMLEAKDNTEEATRAAEQATEAANAAAGRSPYIGENRRWYIWDAANGEYVDSANPSIPALSFEARTGAAGTQVQIEQGGTVEAPVIILTIPKGDTGAVDGVDYYEGDPAALGSASPGMANGLSRGDHVHPMPTAADVGAVSYAAQSLTDEQKAQVKSNIGIEDPTEVEMDLLWTNASPTSEMGSSTISLDLSGYAGVTIELYSASSSIPSHSLASPMIRKNCGWFAVAFASGNSFRRNFYVTENSVNVATGTTGNATADKTQNIPYKIYGVKGVTVS